MRNTKGLSPGRWKDLKRVKIIKKSRGLSPDKWKDLTIRNTKGLSPERWKDLIMYLFKGKCIAY